MLGMRIELEWMPGRLLRWHAAAGFSSPLLDGTGAFRRRQGPWIGLAGILAGSLAGATAASANGDKIAGDLSDAVARRVSSPVRVIVQTQGTPCAADLARVPRLGGRVGRVFKSLPAFTAELPPGAVTRIASLSRVRRVSPDRPVVGN